MTAASLNAIGIVYLILKTVKNERREPDAIGDQRIRIPIIRVSLFPSAFNHREIGKPSMRPNGSENG